MSIKKIKKVLLLSSLFIYFVIVIINNEKKSSLIEDELIRAIQELEINYDITTQRYINDSSSSHTYIKQNKDLIRIYSQLQDSNSSKKDLLRKELFTLLGTQYESLQQRGVLQFHFFLPDNTSFLRMHKPSKYGDDLSDIRFSMKNTNLTHKQSSGFEQGRVAHGFRNVFPIFDTNQTYLGAYEISYSSESLQKHLLNTNKIHSHFLVNKNIFDSNTWNTQYLVLKYQQSIENPSYMFNLTASSEDLARLAQTQTNIIKPNEELITVNMENSRKFSLYQELENSVKIVSFIPIKTIKNDITAAYLVSYIDSPHIVSILSNYRFINIVSFLLLAAVFYLAYQEILAKQKLRIHAQEQSELLSLFDNGEITLFKWNNDATWSVSYVSNNVKSLTGYNREEFNSNTLAYSSIVDKKHIQRVTKEVENAVNNNVDIFTHKPYKIITKNNEKKWVHDITNVIRNSNGDITHFLGYIVNITELKKLEQEVQELNKNLHTEVKKQTDENLKKDQLLQEQSKLAAMGEMVGSIAHQWRQPLNSLNINIQNLDDDYADGMINEKFLNNFIDKQTKTIQFMSQTIDDFRNFFRVDKVKKTFSLKKAIESTISIQSAQLTNYNIEIKLLGEDFLVHGIESEFLQVILNLISNAKDAIIENKTPYGLITVTLKKHIHAMSICDNAGGIPEHIKSRIFEPYFTTKEQGQGTGMGLYMSKIIIEQHMLGKLSIENKGILAERNGAIFTIKLPK